MGEQFVVNIPLLFADTIDPLNQFRTTIKINATPEIVGSDLRIVLDELNAGEVNLSNEHIANILTMIGDNDIIEEGAFVIKNFDQQMSASGMGIESVALMENKLRIYITLSETIPLQDLQDAVEDVLAEVSGDPSYPPELNDAIDDLLAEVANPEGNTEEAVNELIEVFEGLSDEDQQALFDDLVAAFESTDVDYEDLYGLIP
jgi:hypothetical protein